MSTPPLPPGTSSNFVCGAQEGGVNLEAQWEGMLQHLPSVFMEASGGRKDTPRGGERDVKDHDKENSRTLFQVSKAEEHSRALYRRPPLVPALQMDLVRAGIPEGSGSGINHSPESAPSSSLSLSSLEDEGGEPEIHEEDDKVERVVKEAEVSQRTSPEVSFSPQPRVSSEIVVWSPPMQSLKDSLSLSQSLTDFPSLLPPLSSEAPSLLSSSLLASLSESCPRVLGLHEGISGGGGGGAEECRGEDQAIEIRREEVFIAASDVDDLKATPLASVRRGAMSSGTLIRFRNILLEKKRNHFLEFYLQISKHQELLLFLKLEKVLEKLRHTRKAQSFRCLKLNTVFFLEVEKKLRNLFFPPLPPSAIKKVFDALLYFSKKEQNKKRGVLFLYWTYQASIQEKVVYHWSSYVSLKKEQKKRIDCFQNLFRGLEKRRFFSSLQEFCSFSLRRKEDKRKLNSICMKKGFLGLKNLKKVDKNENKCREISFFFWRNQVESKRLLKSKLGCVFKILESRGSEVSFELWRRKIQKAKKTDSLIAKRTQILLIYLFTFWKKQFETSKLAARTGVFNKKKLFFEKWAEKVDIKKDILEKQNKVSFYYLKRNFLNLQNIVQKRKRIRVFYEKKQKEREEKEAEKQRKIPSDVLRKWSCLSLCSRAFEQKQGRRKWMLFKKWKDTAKALFLHKKADSSAALQALQRWREALAVQSLRRSAQTRILDAKFAEWRAWRLAASAGSKEVIERFRKIGAKRVLMGWRQTSQNTRRLRCIGERVGKKTQCAAVEGLWRSWKVAACSFLSLNLSARKSRSIRLKRKALRVWVEVVQFKGIEKHADQLVVQQVEAKRGEKTKKDLLRAWIFRIVERVFRRRKMLPVILRKWRERAEFSALKKQMVAEAELMYMSALRSDTLKLLREVYEERAKRKLKNAEAILWD